jgi:predicted nucleotide-binding protein
MLLNEVDAVGTDHEAYLDWDEDRVRWINRTRAALDFIYRGDDGAKQFQSAASAGPRFVGEAWPERFESQYLGVKTAMNILLSLSETLQYAEDPAGTAQARSVPSTLDTDPEIFLVHGRDNDKRDSVARFLEQTGPPGLRLTILDEKAGKGRTLVEKLEQHAGDASYAVVLLTGDDEGRLSGDGELEARARQNVILELGLFTGLLGRDKVAVLYEQGVAIPSDIGGLEYIPISSDWEKRLVRELRDAGWDFSLDRLDG